MLRMFRNNVLGCHFGKYNSCHFSECENVEIDNIFHSVLWKIQKLLRRFITQCSVVHYTKKVRHSIQFQQCDSKLILELREKEREREREKVREREKSKADPEQ
jgi:hypothetical protein